MAAHLLPTLATHHLQSKTFALAHTFTFVVRASPVRLRHCVTRLSARISDGHFLTAVSKPVLIAAANCAAVPAAAARIADRVDIEGFADTLDFDVRACVGAVLEALRTHKAAASAVPSVCIDELLYDLLGVAQLAGSLRNAVGRGPPPVQRITLENLVTDVVENLAAFAVEKFGVAPPTVVTASPAGHTTAIIAPALISYAIAELLKNSYSAHIARYTAAGVDDAPPVRIRIGGRSNIAWICVEDEGGGLDDRGGCRDVFEYNRAPAQPLREASYYYSRDFGATFSGMGVGLARSRVMALFSGGGLSIQSAPGLGARALLTLDATGRIAPDVWVYRDAASQGLEGAIP